MYNESMNGGLPHEELEDMEDTQKEMMKLMEYES